LTEVLDVAKKDGRWTECPSCSEIIITKKLKENIWVCPHCEYHFRIGAKDRISTLCDPDGFEEIDPGEYGCDNLKSCADDAIKGGIAAIDDRRCVLGVMDFSYKGGSMGVDVGQSIIMLMNKAQKEDLPLVMFCASGGVRVQEGIWGLMQMLRTAHARNMIEHVPMITVFTDPTTGGVSASFSALADIIIAEPGTRIGFAGPRVIESTIRCPLPPGFQDAKRLLANGFLDNIVHRHELRKNLSYLLRWF